MKRPFVVLAALMLVLATACSGTTASPNPSVAPTAAPSAQPSGATSGCTPSAADKKLVIGIPVPILNDFVSAEVKAYNSTAAELGNVEVKVLSDESDAAKEKANVETLVTSKVDGIVLWPLDSGSSVSLVDEIAAAGIPVVAVNNQVGTQSEVYSKLVAFAGRNDVAAGEMIAGWIKQQLGGKPANVVMIRGQLGSAPEERRTQGWKNVFGDDPNIHIIADPGISDWSTKGALDAIDAVLGKTHDIQVVYTHAMFFAAPVAKALKDAGLDMSKVIVTGFDYDQQGKAAFGAGLLKATDYYDQGIEGSSGLKALVNYIRTCTSPAEKWIQPPDILLTPDNYTQYEPTY